MGYFFDEGLAQTSNQRFDLEEARKLLADAGHPNGEGIPLLKILHILAARREVQVIKNILKRNLNIDVQLDPKDFPVLIDAFDKMDWDLTRLGSGGDFDPDDGVVGLDADRVQVQRPARQGEISLRLLLRQGGR